jgi:hypothetical protein
LFLINDGTTNKGNENKTSDNEWNLACWFSSSLVLLFLLEGGLSFWSGIIRFLFGSSNLLFLFEGGLSFWSGIILCLFFVFFLLFGISDLLFLCFLLGGFSGLLFLFFLLGVGQFFVSSHVNEGFMDGHKLILSNDKLIHGTIEVILVNSLDDELKVVQLIED